MGKKVILADYRNIIYYDNLFSIYQTSDGGYITTSYNAYMDIEARLILIKLYPNGNVQWIKEIGLNVYGRVIGRSIQQTSNGDYILVGEVVIFSREAPDIIVLKLNDSGDIQWKKIFHVLFKETSHSIQQTSDGGYILGGYTAAPGPPFANGIIIKLDSNGDIEWAKNISAISSEIISSIQQTSDGGYVASGWTNSFASVPGDVDAFILKLDGSGGIQWIKKIGGSGVEFITNVIQTSDGGYIAVGETSSFGNGNFDVFIVKLDRDGNFQWARTIGGADSDGAYFVKQTSDRGYIIAGSTKSFSGTYDSLVIKLDSNGNCVNCNWIQSIIPSIESVSIDVSNFNPEIVSAELEIFEPTISSPDITSQINVNTICNCSSGSMINFRPLAMSLPSLTEIIKIIEEKIERIIRK